MEEVSEISVHLDHVNLTLRGQFWGDASVSTDKRILAWPGWLDSAGSWTSFAKIFMKDREYCMVCIDPPGTGISSHKSDSSFNCEHSEVQYVISVADKLGWTEPFNLLAHSRGSNIASTVAAAFPHRIRTLLMFEGILGSSSCYLSSYRGLDEVVGIRSNDLRDLCKRREQRLKAKPALYSSLKEAIRSLTTHPLYPKSKESGYNIGIRGLESLKNGSYTFTHDTKLYGFGDYFALYPGSIEKVKKNIKCPCLITCGSKALGPRPTSWEQYRKYSRTALFYRHTNETILKMCLLDWIERLKVIDHLLTYRVIEGFHHVHSDNPREASTVVKQFLKMHENTKVKAQPLHDLHRMALEEYGEILKHEDDDEVEILNLPEIYSKTEIKVSSIDGTISVAIFGDFYTGILKDRVFLCLSDDQDNASSFFPLAQELSEGGDAFVITFDRPGQGGSYKKKIDEFYNSVEDFTLIWRILKYFNIEKCHLIAHERGVLPMIIFSRWFPEMAITITMITSLGSASEGLAPPDEFLASNYYFSHLENSRELQASLSLEKYYRSQRMKQLFKLRNKETNFLEDPRRNIRPPFVCCEKWRDEDLVCIEAPILLIRFQNKQTQQLLKSFEDSNCSNLVDKIFDNGKRDFESVRNHKNTKVICLNGSRYVHVDRPRRIASEIVTRLQSLERSKL